MALTDLQGWMPVDAVVVEGRPGLSWMNMAGVELADPFFQQTVDRLRSEHPDRRETFAEFDTLIRLEKTFDSVAPTGFIFHSSRCGSTLLSNACRALPGAIVLSEPPAVDKLLARFVTDTDEHGTKAMLYSLFLRAAINALAQHRTGQERHLFVKFACCSTMQIERIQRIWPNVPWVFLYRDPVETIVSNMRNRPSWLMDDHRVLASIIDTRPEEVAQMSAEELCARSIASFFATAHRVANDRALLLNYNQLSTAEISNVLNFFGIELAPAEMETIARQSQMYSKAASGARAFVADAETKQQLATGTIREAAERWANKPYQLLEQKRLGIKNHDVV
ncbi:MAG TPA: sulfotransferase [Pyrinomonadaceae bacterium]|nr:sulfotransferase [Pyrinomonadaceae bacterium]